MNILQTTPQWNHSAAAGKWSDYVSNFNTYRWDRLDSWEYRWIDTSLAAGGTFVGQPKWDGIRINFPAFPYFFQTDFGYLYDSGFMVMGSNRDLGSPSLSILSANLAWKFRLCGPNAAADTANDASVIASPDAVPCNTYLSKPSPNKKAIGLRSQPLALPTGTGEPQHVSNTL